MARLVTSARLSSARTLLVALGILAVTAPALAVTEPNGLSVPQPLSADLPYEKTPGSLTLQSLFTSRNEQINWQSDALTSPAAFSPLCGFTGTLVLRGGGCKVDFGWYNVNPNNTPPLDSEIYTLVPKSDPIFNQTFAPQVGEQGQTFTAAAIQMDPNYKGGLIGFATRGNPAEACSQTHYSQEALNVVCTNCNPNGPWVTTLIYKSTATPDAYYMAFEDLPMSPTDFKGFPGQQYTNDGDFNDFVYFITGINCQGAGQPCDTKKQGVCKDGLTDCSTGNQLDCKQQVQPSPEKCDGLDNDCNGMVDEGNLCAADEVCDKGTCVKACGGAEFPCPGILVCNAAGYCVDPACEKTMCPEGQVCRGGSCVGPCDGVVCPLGQACRVGKCVDPCAGVNCGVGRVCEAGVCVTSCGCKACDATHACDAMSGHCVDQGCDGKSCMQGQVCQMGNCVDACQGAMCPGGGMCVSGQCMDPPPDMSSSASGAGGSVFAGTGGGFTAVSSSSGAGGMGDDGSGGAGGHKRPTEPGCGCVVGGEDDSLAAGGAGLLLMLIGALRRRRAARR